MKELEALISSLNESLLSNKEVIRHYDDVKDNFTLVQSRADNISANNIIFDFDKYSKRYSKALSSNDFAEADLVIQEASGAMDMVERSFDEAERRLENFDSVYSILSKKEIPRQDFIDNKKDIDKSASKGDYDDVIRMCMASIASMNSKVGAFESAREAIVAAEESIKNSQTESSASKKLLNQSKAKFDSGDYLAAVDLARDSASESLSSNEEYSESMEMINEARSQLERYNSVMNTEALESLHLEAVSALNTNDFTTVSKSVKKFNSQLKNDLKNSKPKINVDFIYPELIKGDYTKVRFLLENSGTGNAENFHFQLVGNEKIVDMGSIQQGIDKLEIGEKKEFILFLEFKVSGNAIPFQYEIEYTNIVSEEEDSVKGSIELTVLSSKSQQSADPSSSFVPRSKATFSPWDAKKVGVINGDEDKLFEYLDKHREAYLKYPQNETVIDFLNNNKSRFSDISIYFDIPSSPNDVLYNWGLPEKLKGNVILDDKRQAILDEVLSSKSGENFVILGEPGIGKTSLLFEIFDRFIENVPTGVLSSGVTEIKSWNSDLGVRLFYDDIPENDTLVEALTSSSPKGIVLSARREDWNKLDSNLRNKFTERSIEVFNDEMMFEVSTRMLNFSGIISSEAVIRKLIKFAEGSPIYVYCMIKELLNKNETALHDDYIKVHARKGMHNYIAGLLQRLIMKRGESDYKEGGLHALVCLYFLSGLNEKRCSMTFFRNFADNISKHTEEKLSSSKSRIFNDVLRYMSGSSLTVKFPHDTWADVVTNNMAQQSVFLQDIMDIKDKFVRTGIFSEVKEISCRESWERVKSDFTDDPNRYVDSFFALAETLMREFTTEELESFEWFDVGYLHQKSGQYSSMPLAKQISNNLVSSRSQSTNITIKDSVINRSNIGGGNVRNEIVND